MGNKKRKDVSSSKKDENQNFSNLFLEKLEIERKEIEENKKKMDEKAEERKRELKEKKKRKLEEIKKRYRDAYLSKRQNYDDRLLNTQINLWIEYMQTPANLKNISGDLELIPEKIPKGFTIWLEGDNLKFQNTPIILGDKTYLMKKNIPDGRILNHLKLLFSTKFKRPEIILTEEHKKYANAPEFIPPTSLTYVKPIYVESKKDESKGAGISIIFSPDRSQSKIFSPKKTIQGTVNPKQEGDWNEYMAQDFIREPPSNLPRLFKLVYRENTILELQKLNYTPPIILTKIISKTQFNNLKRKNYIQNKNYKSNEGLWNLFFMNKIIENYRDEDTIPKASFPGGYELKYKGNGTLEIHKPDGDIIVRQISQEQFNNLNERELLGGNVYYNKSEEKEEEEESESRFIEEDIELPIEIEGESEKSEDIELPYEIQNLESNIIPERPMQNYIPFNKDLIGKIGSVPLKPKTPINPKSPSGIRTRWSKSEKEEELKKLWINFMQLKTKVIPRSLPENTELSYNSSNQELSLGTTDITYTRSINKKQFNTLKSYGLFPRGFEYSNIQPISGEIVEVIQKPESRYIPPLIPEEPSIIYEPTKYSYAELREPLSYAEEKNAPKTAIKVYDTSEKDQITEEWEAFLNGGKNIPTKYLDRAGNYTFNYKKKIPDDKTKPISLEIILKNKHDGKPISERVFKYSEIEKINVLKFITLHLLWETFMDQENDFVYKSMPNGAHLTIDGDDLKYLIGEKNKYRPLDTLSDYQKRKLNEYYNLNIPISLVSDIVSSFADLFGFNETFEEPKKRPEDVPLPEESLSEVSLRRESEEVSLPEVTREETVSEVSLRRESEEVSLPEETVSEVSEEESREESLPEEIYEEESLPEVTREEFLPEVSEEESLPEESREESLPEEIYEEEEEEVFVPKKPKREKKILPIPFEKEESIFVPEIEFESRPSKSKRFILEKYLEPVQVQQIEELSNKNYGVQCRKNKTYYTHMGKIVAKKKLDKIIKADQFYEPHNITYGCSKNGKILYYSSGRKLSEDEVPSIAKIIPRKIRKARRKHESGKYIKVRAKNHRIMYFFDGRRIKKSNIPKDILEVLDR
jgi:hypothetical protein